MSGKPILLTTAGKQAADGKMTSLLTATFGASLPAATPPNVDWTVNNRQSLTLVASITAAFTAPSGVSNLTLQIVQGGAGSFTIAWPGTVKWPQGTAPTLSTTPGAIDFVSFLYDGTNYYGQAAAGPTGGFA